jgi:hypothetical protein
MPRRISLLTVLLVCVAHPPAHAKEAQSGNEIHKKEQQLEQELKTERDRPNKKERAKAAAGRVEDGVREFGRGVQDVMKGAGIGDGPGTKSQTKPAAKPVAGGRPAKVEPLPASAPRKRPEAGPRTAEPAPRPAP